jgi:hypothetical protein
MKVLVSAASKYRATSEIAQAVADVLAGKDLEVTVAPPEQAGAIESSTPWCWAARSTWASGSNPPASSWNTKQPPWSPGRPGCFPAARSANRPSPLTTPSTSRKSSRPPRPATTTSSPADWSKPPQLPRPGHRFGPPRRRGRFPELGRHQAMGGQHRRHPACFMTAESDVRPDPASSNTVAVLGQGHGARHRVQATEVP